MAATSQSAVAAYESGARQPTWPVLARMIGATGNVMRVQVETDPRLFRRVVRRHWCIPRRRFAGGPMLDAAREVADELGLPRSWLNNQASSYVSGRAGRGTPVYDHPNLRVLTTPPEHLLAMKVRAARAARDADDIGRLLDALGIHSIDEVIQIVERYFADEPLSPRSRHLIEDLLAE